MATTPTVVVEADWGRTGLYDHASADITADVLALSTERGRDYGSQLIGRSVAGKCVIDLLNTTGKYSRSNASGALYGMLEPGVPVRVRVTSPSAATLWTGFLAKVEASEGEMRPGAPRKARLTATGPLARLRALGTVNVVPQTTILTGEAIAVVLDAAGWAKNIASYLVDTLGAVGYWKLNETSGTTATDYGSGAHDGTFSGPTTLDSADLDDEGNGAPDFTGLLGITNVNGNPVFGHATPGNGYTLTRITVADTTQGDHPLASFGVTTVEQATSTANFAYHRKSLTGLTPGDVYMGVVIWRAKQGGGGIPNGDAVFNVNATSISGALADGDTTWKICAQRATVGGGGTLDVDAYCSWAGGAGKVNEVAYFGIINLTSAGLTGISDLSFATFSLASHAVYVAAGNMGTGYSWSGTAHASNSVRAGSYVSGSDAALPSGAAARSILLRVNLDVVNVTDQPLFSYGRNVASQGLLIEAYNANVRVGKYGTNSGASTGTITASTDTTILVTISAAGDITFYLQGVAAGTTTLAAINTVLNEFRIADAPSGWGLPSTGNGRIGHVAVFDRVLTAAEAAAIHARFEDAPRHLDAGQTSLPRWSVERLNALSAVADLEETERGFLLEDASGAIVFEDRHHRLKNTHLDSQATFSDASGATLPYSRFVPRDVDAEIFNKAEIPVRNFTAAALAVVWTYRGDNPTIAPGASLELWANYPGSSVPSGRYVDAWTTPVVGTDITQTGVANGDLAVAADKFSQSMKITITNNHATATATLTLVQARGTAVTENEATIVKSEDTVSSDPDTGYGERTVPRVGAWHQDIELAQDIADYMVSRYANPLNPIPIGIGFEATRSADLMTQALTRDLSDHITVVANAANGVGLGISGDYYIESIRIDIRKSRTRMDVFYDLSPVGGDGEYWAIGEVGYSELGLTTRLAPP